ncbi:3'-5' exonuclease [Sulfuriflexus sp.]|uniref:3'-5' exonuclease n=1 Tax=Sulfuriflexus sp. TaxID=2015443 RepID=UPI0028CBFB56|nr:3'-5' exonuclease [Sulfuriflexus sp.]MDT8404774.1 3'-5' exonuclease [Sulfuriflexus sp.]
MNDCIQQLEATGDYRVIKRFTPVAAYCEPNEAPKRIGIFLDTETTGLDVETDKVIELAMVPFEFDASGRIYRLLPEYNGLNDPGMPIPEIAQQITGITDEMVKGQAIDFAVVKQLLSQAAIVIAHNARFDRPFCENLLDEFKAISWACSIADVNWQEEGIEGVKLEFLAYKYGFFFEGHRATIDCQAGIEILSRPLPVSAEPVLKRLLETARRTEIRLWAEGAPFDKKDQLKKRGYRWSPGENGKRKAWYRDLPEDELDAEMLYLGAQIYSREITELPMDRFTAMLRYSSRL